MLLKFRTVLESGMKNIFRKLNAIKLTQLEQQVGSSCSLAAPSLTLFVGGRLQVLVAV